MNLSELTFLFLQTSGFIIGLGAVTVIDLHGFIAQKSEYWTEATTRTHKVTKPLIWLGTILLTVGLLMQYVIYPTNVITLIRLLLIVPMFLNGIFLSFSVSPYLLKREKEDRSAEILSTDWQWKIRASFVVSFIGWWSSVLLFVYQIAS